MGFLFLNTKILKTENYRPPTSSWHGFILIQIIDKDMKGNPRGLL
jgi:hypothetical protein